eukprot:TRINITY_DN10228_c1_g2_i1.p1 TRINITY_DN10228_c1_g2~~TRINITY_DN10228_c1_g2_i1.p1  ORF type:complete len:888 (+),score=391.65 TRINITY_DN10228_c1_g2_i1:106-2664(+)
MTQAVDGARKQLLGMTAPGVVTDYDRAFAAGQQITEARYAFWSTSRCVYPADYPPPAAGDGSDVFKAADEGGEGKVTRKEVAKYLMRNQTLRHRLREGWAQFNSNFGTEDIPENHEELDMAQFCKLWAEAAAMRADAAGSPRHVSNGSAGGGQFTAMEQRVLRCAEIRQLVKKGGLSDADHQKLCEELTRISPASGHPDFRVPVCEERKPRGASRVSEYAKAFEKGAPPAEKSPKKKKEQASPKGQKGSPKGSPQGSPKMHVREFAKQVDAVETGKASAASLKAHRVGAAPDDEDAESRQQREAQARKQELAAAAQQRKEKKSKEEPKPAASPKAAAPQAAPAQQGHSHHLRHLHPSSFANADLCFFASHNAALHKGVQKAAAAPAPAPAPAPKARQGAAKGEAQGSPKAGSPKAEAKGSPQASPKAPKPRPSSPASKAAQPAKQASPPGSPPASPGTVERRAAALRDAQQALVDLVSAEDEARWDIDQQRTDELAGPHEVEGVGSGSFSELAERLATHTERLAQQAAIREQKRLYAEQQKKKREEKEAKKLEQLKRQEALRLQRAAEEEKRRAAEMAKQAEEDARREAEAEERRKQEEEARKLEEQQRAERQAAEERKQERQRQLAEEQEKLRKESYEKHVAQLAEQKRKQMEKDEAVRAQREAQERKQQQEQEKARKEREERRRAAQERQEKEAREAAERKAAKQREREEREQQEMEAAARRRAEQEAEEERRREQERAELRKKKEAKEAQRAAAGSKPKHTEQPAVDTSISTTRSKGKTRSAPAAAPAKEKKDSSDKSVLKAKRDQQKLEDQQRARKALVGVGVLLATISAAAFIFFASNVFGGSAAKA